MARSGSLEMSSTTRCDMFTGRGQCQSAHESHGEKKDLWDVSTASEKSKTGSTCPEIPYNMRWMA